MNYFPQSAVVEQADCAENISEVPIARLTSSSLLARNAVLNLFGEGWTFLVLLVAMPKLIAFLGETSFGLFSLAWVVIGYLSFLDIGVNRAATKFISEHLAGQEEDSVCDLVRTAFLANLALGIVGGAAVVFMTPLLVHSVIKVSTNLSSQARLAFYAVGAAVPVLLVQGILRAVLSSYQRFGWINGVNIVAVTLQWGAAVWLAWRGYGVAVVVFATVVVRLLATVGYGVVLWRLIPGLVSWRAHRAGGLFKLLKFGSWVSVSQVISPVLVYLDRVLIASFVSLGAVALYTVPYEVMTRLRVIPSSLATTLYPAFSERGSEGQQTDLRDLYERSTKYLLLMLSAATLFLAVLGPDLLGLWMGKMFATQTALVLQVLALGVLVNGMSYVPYNMLQAVGRPDLTAKFHLFELIPYILLCVLLIPRWGITGAAVASVFRFSLDFCLLFWAAARHCRCSVRKLMRLMFVRILPLSVALGIALGLIRYSFSGTKTRLLVGIFSTLLYVPLVWIFAVEKNERPRISRAVRQILGQIAA